MSFATASTLDRTVSAVIIERGKQGDHVLDVRIVTVSDLAAWLDRGTHTPRRDVMDTGEPTTADAENTSGVSALLAALPGDTRVHAVIIQDGRVSEVRETTVREITEDRPVELQRVEEGCNA
jgi:hypothetical protein